jgi:hypothetical protein
MCTQGIDRPGVVVVEPLAFGSAFLFAVETAEMLALSLLSLVSIGVLDSSSHSAKDRCLRHYLILSDAFNCWLQAD